MPNPEGASCKCLTRNLCVSFRVCIAAQYCVWCRAGLEETSVCFQGSARPWRQISSISFNHLVSNNPLNLFIQGLQSPWLSLLQGFLGYSERHCVVFPMLASIIVLSVQAPVSGHCSCNAHKQASLCSPWECPRS